VSAEEETESYLVIENVPHPTTKSSALRAFINCASPSLQTSLEDASYVGTISFFGGDHAAEAGAAMPGMGSSSFSVNITDALRRAIEANYTPGSPIEVALVPVDLSAPERVSKEEVIRPGRIQVVALGAQL
jgi:hypothetical protein